MTDPKRILAARERVKASPVLVDTLKEALNNALGVTPRGEVSVQNEGVLLLGYGYADLPTRDQFEEAMSKMPIPLKKSPTNDGSIEYESDEVTISFFYSALTIKIDRN